MNDESNTNFEPAEPPPRSHAVEHWNSSAQASGGAGLPNGENPAKEFSSNGKVAASFTPWPFVEMLVRSWHWLILGGCVLAGLGFVAGTELWQTRYTASAELLRFETPNNSDYFKPRVISEGTFGSMLRSPELL